MTENQVPGINIIEVEKKIYFINTDWKIVFRKVDDGWLVYHSGDGSSHYLQGVLAELLGIFLSTVTPLSVMMIAEKLKNGGNVVVVKKSILDSLFQLELANIIQAKKSF